MECKPVSAVLSKSPAPLVLIAFATVLGLAGCSGRDTDMAEKLARAEAAAQRAEAAATRAETAAKREPARAPEPVEEDEPEQHEPAPGAPTVEPTPTI